jgi:hypothetical protein
LYAAEYKRIYNTEQQQILNAFNTIIAENGKFTARHLGALCNQFRLPVKVMDEFLPEITNHQYRCGTWERIKRSGIKARHIGVIWFD